MKNERHQTIVGLLKDRKIKTQGELAKALQELGFQVTQATVSRDMRELRLVKTALPEGGYKYSVPGNEGRNVNDRMIRMLRDSLLSADYAGNMVVVKTLSGSANSAAEALDSMEWPEVLGSIAGDNTLFMVVKNETDASAITERILSLTEHERKN